MSLYGDIPLKAAGDLVKIIETKDPNAVQFWAYFGKFLYEQYKEKDFDHTITDQLLREFSSQNHSGGSHGVMIQTLMEFLSGKMTEEDKKKLRAKP